MKNNIINHSIALENINKYYKFSKDNKKKLLNEFSLSGINVLLDFLKFKEVNSINFFEYSEKLESFYKETDGFIYELSAWHCTYERYLWKKNIISDIKKIKGNGKLKILVLGDGIGYDSLYLFKNIENSEITYFEFENSKSFNFAKNLFKDKKYDINLIGKLENIKKEYYDIVISLDVLEHVDNVHEVIKNIYSYLVNNGICFISEAFGSVEIMRPTHLFKNLKYVGKIIHLFNKYGFFYIKKSYKRIYIFEKGKKYSNFSKNKIKDILKEKIIYIYYKLFFKLEKKSNVDQKIKEIKKYFI